jgi:3-oxoacyl-[acyl-carrier protein] reductase
MNTLAGKTAIVTGATRGPGRVAALALAKAGAQVIVHHRQSPGEAQAVVAEIRRLGGRSDALAVDLAAHDGPQRLARRVRAIVGERLDILVAHTGMQGGAAASDTAFNDFSRRFALNVRAPYFLVQQLLPIMCKGSCVVFLVPWLAQGAAAQSADDAAIAGAVQTLTKHFALALGERGVRVNAIAIAPALGRHASAAQINAPVPGDAVTFLASDAARWITGEIVRITRVAELPRTPIS